MLAKLTIKNVALIERADICFGEGLNVLSGETGAGKSVILDSVNFVLGAKADRSMIRYGETECFVKAEFILPETSSAVQILRELDVETDGEIIISRTFSINGKNAVKINGCTVTTSMLRKVTDSLVDVHGQSEHFFLLKESNQLKTLDEVIGEPIIEKKSVLAELIRQRKDVESRIALLGGDEKERERRLDILRFQIDEIQAVDLKDGEEEELLAKRNKMNNVEKILRALQDCANSISAESGALDNIRYAKRSMSAISHLDSAYETIHEQLDSLTAEAEDIAERITDLADELYFDEREAEEVESRLDCINDLKRKYGANKPEIDAYLEKIQAEYDLLADCDGQYQKLTKQKAALEKKIYTACTQITELRKTQGAAFCKRVTDELKTLNIANAAFEIQFTPYQESDVSKVNASGLDDICFLFSANAGEPLKPLGKIISGGEMSRFMLAIKTQIADINEICTYIFDEIDAGISGKTAKVVGEKLATIAKDTQIIAVSHLAQIAVMADDEFLIEKQENDGKTLTNVYALDDEGKKKEIVRLLGGGDADEFAVKHAEELLNQAKLYKNTIS